MRLTIVLTGLLLAAAFAFPAAPAANAAEPQQSSSILMNVVPENPVPGDNVSITLSSYFDNLDSADIVWTADGKTLASGTGLKSVLVTAPAAGSQTTVTATLTMANKLVYYVTTTIRPAETVMLWQAEDSYVPPFYKGKALPSPDTLVKVVAMPEIRNGGKLVDPSTLTYAWQKDFTNTEDGNGYGMNSYTFRNDYLERSNTIGVTAKTADGQYASEGRTTIAMYTPMIDFYKKDDVLGTIWEHSIESGHVVAGQETIVGAPYFVSPKDIRRPDLGFHWSINGNPVTIANYSKTQLPLKVEGGVSGSSHLELDIDDAYKFFETASKEIYVSF